MNSYRLILEPEWQSLHLANSESTYWFYALWVSMCLSKLYFVLKYIKHFSHVVWHLLCLSSSTLLLNSNPQILHILCIFRICWSRFLFDWRIFSHSLQTKDFITWPCFLNLCWSKNPEEENELSHSLHKNVLSLQLLISRTSKSLLKFSKIILRLSMELF